MAKDPLHSIAQFTTVAECEAFERNADRLGRNDLAAAARRRAISLGAAATGATNEIERLCIEAIHAYERVLTQRNGRKTHASRTWPMVKRHGILGAVERAVCRDTETAGYAALAQMGLAEYAFEAVILRFPESFSAEAVAISKARMASAGKEQG